MYLELIFFLIAAFLVFWIVRAIDVYGEMQHNEQRAARRASDLLERTQHRYGKVRAIERRWRDRSND